MIIRQLEKEEHWRTRALYEEVFSEDSASFVTYYYTEKTKDNRIYVAEEDGQIRAMLHLNPYTLMVQGEETQSCYIVAVATQEAYRGRGFMRVLLHRALKELCMEGVPFVYLMPASEAIYRPFDFCTVYEQRHACAGEAAGAKEVRETELSRLAREAETYLSQNYQVYAKRTPAYYRRWKKECESEGGKLLVLRDAAGRITDIRAAYRQEDGDSHKKIMMRIVDVRRMLTCLRVKEPMSVCIRTTDPILVGNNRCLRLTGTEGTTLAAADETPESAEGTLPVAALAGLVFGVRSADELAREPDVKMTERLKEELKKIIPLSGIYLNEEV